MWKLRSSSLPRPIAVVTLFAWALSGAFAGAAEYSLPDPPNSLTFESVPVRVVAVPKENVPESCGSQYRSGMESAFKEIWAQCQQVGKMEPSDCQRAVFERCTQLAIDMQKMESGACLKMDGESDALKSFKGVDNQLNSQSSTADLNRRAYVATRQVIDALQQSVRDIDSQRKNAVSLLASSACSASTSARAYDGLAVKVVKQLTAVKSHVNSTISAKQSAAAQFATNSGVSIQNLEQLVSLPPRSSTITGASSKPDTLAPNSIPSSVGATSSSTATSVVSNGPSVYVGTVVETVTGSVATPGLTTVTTTASVPSPAPAAAPSAVPRAVLLPPYTPPPEKKNINWVPILAVGVPAAAILTALALSKNSRNQVSSDPGGNGGFDGANPGSGNQNPTPTLVPGGGDLAAWKITLDPSFTDRQKAGIAAGFAKIPRCYRYKLQGLYMRNRLLPRLENGCIAGQFYFGGNTIDFSPTCTHNDVPIGVAVHEMFHVLGNRNNNELHNQFWPVLDRHPSCPVSAYGATNRLEDFAETGRLLEFPDSSVGAKNPGACVDAKISELGRILSSCSAH